MSTLLKSVSVSVRPSVYPITLQKSERLTGIFCAHSRDVHGGAAAVAVAVAARQREFIFYDRRGAARQRQLPKKENLKNS
jgi:hypothetical protein